MPLRPMAVNPHFFRRSLCPSAFPSCPSWPTDSDLASETPLRQSKPTPDRINSADLRIDKTRGEPKIPDEILIEIRLHFRCALRPRNPEHPARLRHQGRSTSKAALE